MLPGRALLLLCAALAFTQSRSGPAPRFDQWRIIGPGGAGGMFLPTISPHDPKIVIERCDMTGSYISLDGGESWRMFNLRSGTSGFAFDPIRPNVIYAVTSALWRSEDTGRTWSMILPDPKKNTVEHMRGDHASAALTSDDPAYPAGHRVRMVAVDPNDSKRLYLALTGRRAGGSSTTALLLSADYGRTWSKLKEFTEEQVLLISLLPGKSTVTVVTDAAAHVMAGGEWQRFAGPAGQKIQSASAGAQDGVEYVYATTAEPGGLYVSRDGARTWEKSKLHSGDMRMQSIACSWKHGATAYVGFAGPRTAGRNYGVAKTTDGGKTWSIAYQESSEPAENVEHSWVADFYGGGGTIRDIYVAPGDPNVVQLTDSCPRPLRTVDGGRTWREVMSAYRGKDRWGRDKWTTTGYDTTTCYGVHFDPFNPKNMFISYTDVGLWKSIDGGQSWMSSIRGTPSHWANTTYWVEFDPKVRGLMWGAFARTHDLPRPKMWRQNDPDNFQGGIGISRDGGDHWVVAQGLPEMAVTHLILDPDSPVGARTLYAAAFGKGVYKSADDGKTWVLKNSGIDYKQPFAWRLTRAKNGTLYLVVARRSDDGSIGGPGDGALYRSTDGAESWVKMKLPEGVNGPTGLSLDPEDNSRMYLSAWGVSYTKGTDGGGVFLSTDDGQTWKAVFTESQHVYDVKVDPRNPNVVYNCGFSNGAYRSADRGITWKRIKGFNFKWGHRVIPDPSDAAKVYITTFGGSVWHGPAEGDPNSQEDVVTAVRVER